MTKTVISVENLSKSYRLGQIGTGTLSRDLEVWWAKVRGKPNPLLKIGQTDHGNQDGQTLWALKDVSFQVQQGEVLGIIGRNGAGKSTLLKILSRVTAPTSGQVKVKGRIASLLEVGTGFHPELTGRENIFLNGAILGMSKLEVQRKFDEIVSFAEVEKFVDTPVKRYSSGMYVRLAFAVAAHLESEILLVDEVLAVGDAEFQKKCLGKMGDVATNEGRTIFFVSHNMVAIRQLCHQGLVLDHGMIQYLGGVFKGIENYLQSIDRKSKSIIENIKKYDNCIKVNEIKINGQAEDNLYLSSDENELEIFVSGEISKSIKMNLEVRITDIYGTVLGLYSPGHLKGKTDSLLPGQFNLNWKIKLPFGITRGNYYLNISLTEPNVAIWVEIPQAVCLSMEGFPTLTGRAIEYTSGAGWLLLGE
jgi:lipopolysaccharide transport system ATP-binding protein